MNNSNESPMRETVSEWLWVYVEAAGACRYGRVARRHYETLIAGNYTARFLTLDDVFWLHDSRPIRACKRPVAPQFQGTFHLQVGFISTIAPVEDCTLLFLPFFTTPGQGQSAWEREQEASAVSVSPAPKKRSRKAVS